MQSLLIGALTNSTTTIGLITKKYSTETLNHPTPLHILPLLSPNKSRKHSDPLVFNPITLSRIKPDKISQSSEVRSLIVQTGQVLPCVPACDCQFQVLAVYLHPHINSTCPIICYRWQKVRGEGFHHWGYARGSGTHPCFLISLINTRNKKMKS